MELYVEYATCFMLKQGL